MPKNIKQKTMLQTIRVCKQYDSSASDGLVIAPNGRVSQMKDSSAVIQLSPDDNKFSHQGVISHTDFSNNSASSSSISFGGYKENKYHCFYDNFDKRTKYLK